MGLEILLGELKNKYMELGLCDKVFQVFWYEWCKGNIIFMLCGDVVYFDLCYFGEKKLYECLLFICELVKVYVGVDLVKELILVCLIVYYIMGGIEIDQNCEICIKGLFVVGECFFVGLYGVNCLGFNFLVELVVFGCLVGE